jgi:dipeptidyl-peptidase 9
VQEEFDRYTGYWWQPPPSGLWKLMSTSPWVLNIECWISLDYEQSSEEIYHILYETVDESEVEVLNIVSSSGTVDQYRYPKAGWFPFYQFTVEVYLCCFGRI